jgi:hypothetical protein
MADPTQEELKKVLRYDPDTGIFTWRVTKPGNAKKGSEAGYLNDGYRKIKINDILYGAHRLSWLYMTGELPTVLIDHKDGDRSNNRWDNLRKASDSQNQGNVEMRDDNPTGEKNVLRSKSGAFIVKIVKNDKIYRKRFEKKEDAVVWRDRMLEKLQGAFAKT